MKVISVGNITSGGSGKTPFGIYLAEMLRGSGLRVAISHRGYKGAFENFPTLISDGNHVFNTVQDAGDEAFMIASKLKDIPVVVGKKRVAAVSLILAKFPETQVVILDDGFQHLKMCRDLDIICFDADTGIGNGYLLPAGYLREPLDAISPSCLAMVIHKNSNTDTHTINALLSTRTPHIFQGFYNVPTFVTSSGDLISSSNLEGKRVALISGIANPVSFENMINKQGINFVKHFSYPDHYHYNDAASMQIVIEFCRSKSIDYLLCTEKDIAKLSQYPELRDMLCALRIELTFPDSGALKSLILKAIGY